MPLASNVTIFRNQQDEEVARVIFEETFPSGWRIKSKITHQKLEHRFSTELEAFNVWHHDFDPETGSLRQQGLTR